MSQVIIVPGKLALTVRESTIYVEKKNPKTGKKETLRVKRTYLDYEVLNRIWFETKAPLKFTAHVYRKEVRVKDSRPTGKSEKPASLDIFKFRQEAKALLGDEDGAKWVRDIEYRLGVYEINKAAA